MNETNLFPCRVSQQVTQHKVMMVYKVISGQEMTVTGGQEMKVTVE